MLSDLFTWNRIVSPVYVRLLFTLTVSLVGIGVLLGIIESVSVMKNAFLTGLICFVGTLVCGAIGILGARIISELVMIAFSIEEHLAAMRARWEA